MVKFLLGIIVFSYVNFSNAAIISEWNLDGSAGNESLIVAASSASNVTGLNLSRGSGLTPRTTANSFNSSNWHNLEAGDFLSFGFTVADGFAVDLTNLSIALRASGTGPGSLGLFYSGDNFSTNLTTFNLSGGSVNEQLVDLSSLQGLLGEVVFTIRSISNVSANGGAIGSSGTMRLIEPANSNVLFNGTVAAVPEPQTSAMLLAGLGLLGWSVRRTA